MISVIIPCYNAEEFIKETLESITSQNVDDLEIIVVDDGSTDNSAAIVQSFNDQRITYVHQNNKGVSFARNYGLFLSKGQYVIFFDADDKMSESFLATRRAALEEYSNIGFSCGPVITFPIEGSITYGIAENIAYHLLTYNATYSSCPSNYLIRKSILTENNILFNKSLASTADRFFLIELSVKTKGKLIGDAPLFYRVNPNSMSNKLTPKLIADNESYFRALKKSGLIPEEVKDEFIFKMKYILGAGFLRTGLYYKGAKYSLEAVLKSPRRFIKQILMN